MARPSNFDREAAVETAMQEIWHNGFEASSVKAISEKLGITRSSFYNAFGSREELFKEALALYARTSPDAALYGDLADMPVTSLIVRTFRAICKARASDPDARGCLAVNCLTEFDTSQDELGMLLADAILKSADRLEELLQIAVERGELPIETQVHATALALQNLMVGINVFSKALRDEEELWLTVRTTLIGLGIYQGDTNA